jgi:hypothetical protein
LLKGSFVPLFSDIPVEINDDANILQLVRCGLLRLQSGCGCGFYSIFLSMDCSCSSPNSCNSVGLQPAEHALNVYLFLIDTYSSTMSKLTDPPMVTVFVPILNPYQVCLQYCSPCTDVWVFHVNHSGTQICPGYSPSRS